MGIIDPWLRQAFSTQSKVDCYRGNMLIVSFETGAQKMFP